MHTLIEHVVSFGHQRIGLVAGQPGLATTRERVEAFRAALAANGLEACRRLYFGGERQHRLCRDSSTQRDAFAARRLPPHW